MASTRACCGAGTTISVRDWASPDIFWLSPMARTMTSAFAAARTASSIPPSSGVSTPEPRAMYSHRRVPARRHSSRLPQWVTSTHEWGGVPTAPNTSASARPGSRCTHTEPEGLKAILCGAYSGDASGADWKTHTPTVSGELEMSPWRDIYGVEGSERVCGAARGAARRREGSVAGRAGGGGTRK